MSGLIEALVVAALVTVMAFRFMHARQGPRLHDRVQAILDPYEGQQLSPDSLVILQAEASTAFHEILAGVGLTAGPWKLRVHADDVLGPVARIHGPGGAVMAVADFEHRLKQGRIELDPL